MTGPPPPSWAVDPEAASARQVLPGVWRLRLPLAWPGSDHVNAYLLDGDDSVVLVDCGSGGDPSCLAALEYAVAQTGHGLADIQALVLTHVHSDHVGSAASVLERSGAQLWCHPNTGHFYDVVKDLGRAHAVRSVRALKEGVPPVRVEAYADVREELTGIDGLVEPDRLLTDGTMVPSALGAWEVLETPGHSPSHVSLLQRETGLLIAGDSVCIAFVPWMDYGFTPDPYGESLASLDRLNGRYPVRLTLPGHGRPLDDLNGIIAAHRVGYATMLDAVRAALAQGPMTGHGLSERLHGVEGDIDAVAHLAEILCLLRHLRLHGEVQRSISDEGRYRYRLAEPADASVADRVGEEWVASAEYGLSRADA